MRDERTGRVRLSRTELSLLWTSTSPVDPPALLGLPRPGRTAPVRRELAERTSANLSARGLGTLHRPAADLAAMLHALAEPVKSFDLVGEPGGLRALAAIGALAQASVTVRGDEVWLLPVQHGMLAGALLANLRPVPAGPGMTANVRLDDFRLACWHAAREGRQRFVEDLRRRGLRPPEAHTLLRALTDRIGGGQIGATVRDTYARPVRAGHPVSWLDTGYGRYALWQEGSWLTLTPASQAKLGELVAALA